MAAMQIDEKGLRQRCPKCGKTNRVPFSKLGEAAKCGACKAEIGGKIDGPADVRSEAAFMAVINSSPLPVLVDYWAPWCGPCRMVAPEIEKVARQLAGQVLVVKVDTQALPRVGAQMKVQSIPTMAVYFEGRELQRSSGARPAPAIASFVNAAVAAA